MRSYRDVSIRRKLELIIMMTVGAALVLACAAFLTYDLIVFRKAMRSDLSALADIVAANTTAALSFNDPKSAEEILAGLRAKPHVVSATIYTTDGKVFASYARAGVPRDFPPPLKAGDSRFRKNRLDLVHRIILDGQVIGTVYLESDLEEIKLRLKRYAGIVIVIMLASAILAFLIASKLQQVISTPILRLAETAKTVSVEKDYSLRAVKHNRDELGLLIDGFNEMLSQIQNRDLELHGQHADLEIAKEKAEQAMRELGAANIELQNEINERKRAERELARLSHQIQLVLDSAGEGIYGVDRDGKATFVNPAATTLLGWEPQEVIGKPMHALMHHSRADGVSYPVEQCPIYEAFRGGTVHRVTNEVFWRKDGKSIPVEYTSTPIREDGELIGAVVTFNDITQRKRLEDELRQSQKMEAIGQLAGGVAHDFNNLLTIIMGYSQVLLASLRDKELHEHVSEIEKAAERAASLTRQLLAFSRRQVLAPQVLDLNAIVANTDKMLRRLIGEDIDLISKLEPELGRVKADPGQIEQVIMNLAVNARDAMPMGGKITLETANAELDGSYTQGHPAVTHGPYVMLALSDTGVGMDAETQKHIFEPFFTTKGKGKGTGLGLATVYGIVKQSGGYIWVYSEPGRGTTFKIYLPRLDERVSAVEQGVEEANLPRGSETVLLVEDEPSVRALARRVLESKGYSVLDASNGAEALVICEQYAGPIHLILTDVVIPDMSGSALGELAASLHQEAKILYMSGYTDDAIVRHGVLDSGMAFLQKPFTPDSLARKVRQALDTRREEPS